MKWRRGEGGRERESERRGNVCMCGGGGERERGVRNGNEKVGVYINLTLKKKRE